MWRTLYFCNFKALVIIDKTKFMLKLHFSDLFSLKIGGERIMGEPDLEAGQGLKDGEGAESQRRGSRGGRGPGSELSR